MAAQNGVEHLPLQLHPVEPVDLLIPVGLVTFTPVSQSPITSMPANTIPCSTRAGPIRAQMARSRAVIGVLAAVPPTWKFARDS